MKSRPSLIVASIAAVSLLSACNRPSDSEGAGVPPTEAPPSPTEATDAQIPVVGIVTETECYTGPDTGYYPVHVLAPGQGYQVAGIDDDVTWFQIDPTAVMDPEPPHAPLNELSPQPDPPGSVRSLRCWVPGDRVDLSGNLSGVPVIEMPVVEMLGSAACYHAPAEGSDIARSLDMGAFFRIVAIDDDVTWIDDDVTWIDDDVTWFQIDPTALIDPDPPHRPLAESSQPTEMRLRCWVPGGRVEISGDLSQVPPFPIPTVLISRDANCRSGPTIEYRGLGFLPLGGRYAVFGRNRGGNAWLVYDPAIRRTCWVHGSLVEMTGDTGLANVVEPPPPEPIPPTEGPVVNCSRYNTNPQACTDNLACEWVTSAEHPNGICKNR